MYIEEFYWRGEVGARGEQGGDGGAKEPNLMSAHGGRVWVNKLNITG